jgi:hypothetical protein
MSTPKQTAAMRWHNPGNVGKLTHEKWANEIARPGRFSGFPTDFDGLVCLNKNLLAYELDHGIRTLDGVVERHAPPNENATDKYQRNVSDWTGLPRDKPISVADNLEKIVPAICHQENGSSCPLDHYPVELIHDAAQAARKYRGLV